MVYKFTVHCIVYSKLLLLKVTVQKCSSLTGWKTDSQSVSYYTFLHCLHVQEKHVATLFGIYCTVVNYEL